MVRAVEPRMGDDAAADARTRRTASRTPLFQAPGHDAGQGRSGSIPVRAGSRLTRRSAFAEAHESEMHQRGRYAGSDRSRITSGAACRYRFSRRMATLAIAPESDIEAGGISAFRHRAALRGAARFIVQNRSCCLSMDRIDGKTALDDIEVRNIARCILAVCDDVRLNHIGHVRSRGKRIAQHAQRKRTMAQRRGRPCAVGCVHIDLQSRTHRAGKRESA